jgi:flagellar basal-body rod protein FlgG
MINGIKRGVSGLVAQVQKLSHISNNIANVTTPGFKRTEGTFGQQLSAEMDTASIPLHPEGQSQTAQGVGYVPEIIFAQGAMTPTGRPWDLAMEGDGFIEVSSAGREVYVRGGSFTVGSDGIASHSSGAILSGVLVPPDATAVEIGLDGSITFAIGESFMPGGAIKLMAFTNAAGLEHLGQGQFAATANSGQAVVATKGYLHQGFLEASNVSLVDEMTSLIQAQRAYQANVRSVQQFDGMWEKTNALRR